MFAASLRGLRQRAFRRPTHLPRRYFTAGKGAIAAAAEAARRREEPAHKGMVTDVRRDTCNVKGLPDARIGSLVAVQGSHEALGVVLALRELNVCVGLLDSSTAHGVQKGHRVQLVSNFMHIPIGNQLLGRTVDGVGRPIDGMGVLVDEIATEDVELPVVPLFSDYEPAITHHGKVVDMLETGIKQLDLFHPLARGMRMALMGPTLTGKTTLALDVLQNTYEIAQLQMAADEKLIQDFNERSGKDTKLVVADSTPTFIYVCVGRSRKHIRRVREELLRRGVLQQTVLVAAPESDSLTLQYLSVLTGSVMASHLRDTGKHAVVVYDDLNAHAREHVHLQNATGQALQGINNIHARVLERSAQLSSAQGGGSSTAICLLETRDLQTNGVTNQVGNSVDHCVFLDADMAMEGQFPALNVSQLLRNTRPRFQPNATRKVVQTVLQILSQSLQMVDQFSWAQNFGLNVEEENVASLQYRDQLQLLLTQNEDQSQRMPIGHQCLLLIAATQYHLLSHIYPENVQRYGVELLEYLKNEDELMFARFTELEPDKYIQERHVSVATRHIKQFDDKIFRN